MNFSKKERNIIIITIVCVLVFVSFIIRSTNKGIDETIDSLKENMPSAHELSEELADKQESEDTATTEPVNASD